jgi:hypothetical protein
VSDPEKTAAEERAKTQAAGGYLPRLPDGWTYQIAVVPTASLSVPYGLVLEPKQPFDTDPGDWRAKVVQPKHAYDPRPYDGATVVKRLPAESLADAARQAAAAARSLTRISIKEQEIRAERSNLIDQLGEIPAVGDDAAGVSGGQITVSAPSAVDPAEVVSAVKAADRAKSAERL